MKIGKTTFENGFAVYELDGMTQLMGIGITEMSLEGILKQRSLLKFFPQTLSRGLPTLYAKHLQDPVYVVFTECRGADSLMSMTAYTTDKKAAFRTLEKVFSEKKYGLYTEEAFDEIQPALVQGSLTMHNAIRNIEILKHEGVPAPLAFTAYFDDLWKGAVIREIKQAN